MTIIVTDRWSGSNKERWIELKNGVKIEQVNFPSASVYTAYHPHPADEWPYEKGRVAVISQNQLGQFVVRKYTNTEAYVAQQVSGRVIRVSNWRDAEVTLINWLKDKNNDQ